VQKFAGGGEGATVDIETVTLEKEEVQREGKARKERTRQLKGWETKVGQRKEHWRHLHDMGASFRPKKA